MNAIAGIYHLDDQMVEPVRLEQMLDTLAHRGDDHKTWCSAEIALANRCRPTTPESIGEQLPLVEPNLQLVMVADARIDNRSELISTLKLHQAIADSQIILMAYRHWGEDCLEHLIGDFAFVIWDQGAQMLFCARDHFGVRPFYYFYRNSTFIFASEVKAILTQPEVSSQLNPTRIADYLTAEFDDTATTLYEHIWRLPPAHWLRVTPEGIKQQAYWKLDPNREIRLGSDGEYAERFREIFTEAVRCRLRSSYTVGSMLSGGLDSSAITCTARQLRQSTAEQPLLTFSAVFEQVKQCDEQVYINEVLAGGDLQPHYIHGDRFGPLDDLERVMWHQDEPLYAFNLNLNWNIYKVAQQQGVRVMLDGFDGDSTVSHGMGYLRELGKRKQWRSLSAELYGYAQKFDSPLLPLLGQFYYHFGLEPILEQLNLIKLKRKITKKIQRRWPNQTAAQPSWDYGLKADFLEDLDYRKRLFQFSQARQQWSENQRQEHYYSLVRGVMPHTLEVLNRASAAFGIELRFPFWDKRLVEFCLALPPQQKLHRGWTRMIMRRAMNGILPAKIQWRHDKADMSHNFDRGLKIYESERIKQAIAHPLIAEYVDSSLLAQAYQQYMEEGNNEQLIFTLWKATTLSLWLQNLDPAA